MEQGGGGVHQFHSEMCFFPLHLILIKLFGYNKESALLTIIVIKEIRATK